MDGYMEKRVNSESGLGLVLNTNRHYSKSWVSASTYYLIEEIIRLFKPVIIDAQKTYEENKNILSKIISMEPGWGAPNINYGKNHGKLIGVFLSDPHSKTSWFKKYFEDNDISFVLSYYYSPFLYHFPNFDRSKIVHFPWSVPDRFIENDNVVLHNNGISIFGGKDSDAYDMRNWCRSFDFINCYNYSGVENKVLSDEKYYFWLRQFDAIVAAGSTNPKYDLVTPKYFEILSSGALLIGQECTDLDLLGINDTNALLFNKTNFISKCKYFLSHPDEFLTVRKNGLSLIKNKHSHSQRMKYLAKLMDLKMYE